MSPPSRPAERTALPVIRLTAGPGNAVPAGWLTATVELTISREPHRLEISLPPGPTRLSELLPIFAGLTNVVVTVAERQVVANGQTVSCKKGSPPAAGKWCRSRRPRPSAWRSWWPLYPNRARPKCGSASPGAPAIGRRRVVRTATKPWHGKRRPTPATRSELFPARDRLSVFGWRSVFDSPRPTPRLPRVSGHIAGGALFLPNPGDCGVCAGARPSFRCGAGGRKARFDRWAGLGATDSGARMGRGSSRTSTNAHRTGMGSRRVCDVDRQEAGLTGEVTPLPPAVLKRSWSDTFGER